MRHVACFGLSLISLFTLAWGCGDDGGGSSSTGDPPVPCEEDRDCETDNPCVRGFCEGSSKECDFRPIASGPQPGAEQIDGDCLSINCNNGESVVEPANDPPEDDGADCMVPVCVDGTPSEEPADAGTDCPLGAGQGICDDAGTCSCAPVPGEPTFVDPELGTDSPSNGGASGACAYKTLSYALSQATNDIRLKAGTYSAATGETLPFVLGGIQRLYCYDQGAQQSATIVGGGTAEGVEAAVILTGSQNRVEGCIIDATGLANGIATVTRGNPHQLRFNEVSGAQIGVAIVAESDDVEVRECNLHDNAVAAIDFQGTDREGQLNTNTFANNGVDIRCADASPDVMGSGNAGATCQVCANCPFQ